MIFLVVAVGVELMEVELLVMHLLMVVQAVAVEQLHLRHIQVVVVYLTGVKDFLSLILIQAALVVVVVLMVLGVMRVMVLMVVVEREK